MDVDFILRRAVAEVISREEMEKLLKSGRKLRLKEGLDPSSTDIHLGHMVGLRKLRQFQELGHQVVLIVGDWTTQIGDPTDRDLARPTKSRDEVMETMGMALYMGAGPSLMYAAQAVEAFDQFSD